MEKGPGKNKISLRNPDIQEKIQNYKLQKKEVEKWIDQDLKSLKFFIDNIEFDRKYLKFQEESAEQFTEEEINKLKRDVSEQGKFIEKIRKEILNSRLDKILIGVKIEELNKMEKHFKKILLKISLERLQ